MPDVRQEVYLRKGATLCFFGGDFQNRVVIADAKVLLVDVADSGFGFIGDVFNSRTALLFCVALEAAFEGFALAD